MKTASPSKLSVYYDAEFTGLHKDTTPISIGLVTDTCCSFYAEFTDYDESQVTEWIDENVIKNLRLGDKPEGYVKRHPMLPSPLYNPNYRIELRGNKEFVKSELIGWLANESHNFEGKQIQFFADCYAYDWVIMNDLIGFNGSALKIPSYVNYIPIDLSTALYMRGIDPDVSREEFVGDYDLKSIKNSSPFNVWETGNIKHNCLWDAHVCRMCFRKLPVIGFDFGK